MWSTLRSRWIRWSNRPALSAESGAELTYGELDAAVAAAARRLSGAGVSEGRVVAVAVPSRPDLVISVLAALHCGARVVLANTRWWPRDLRAAVETAHPGLVLTTATHRPTLNGLAPLAVLADRSGRADWADAAGVDVPRWRPRTGADEARTGSGPGPHARPGPDGDAQAAADPGGELVGYTTGAWREPRPVVFTTGVLIERCCGAEADLGPGATTLVAVDAATTPGLGVVIRTLAGGGRAALSEHDAPGRLLRRLAGGGVRRLWATGPQLNLLAGRLMPGTTLPPLGEVEASGGLLHPPAAARLTAAFGAGIVASLTLTEAAGPVAARDPAPGTAHRPLDVGRPLAGAGLVLVRPDGRPVNGDEVGEVVVESAARLLAAAASRPPDGFPGAGGGLATGDLARWSSERSLQYQGRAAERFGCGEATVWPVLVEAALGTHPGLVDVAVVPRPDSELGMIPVAVTVPLDAESPPFLGDLEPLLADLPSGWRPQAQAVVDRLPLTASGQVHRRMLVYDEVAR